MTLPRSQCFEDSNVVVSGMIQEKKKVREERLVVVVRERVGNKG
jgi:hypothetical protein